MKLNLKPNGFGRPVKMIGVIAAAITAVALQGRTEVCASAPGKGANHAIMSSPRFLEEFPAFALRETRGAESTRKASAENRLAMLASNHALAASPRFIEQHPQVARAPLDRADAHGRTSPNYLPAAAKRSSAWAASPRAIEEFPWLARAGNIVAKPDQEFQVAPVK